MTCTSLLEGAGNAAIAFYHSFFMWLWFVLAANKSKRVKFHMIPKTFSSDTNVGPSVLMQPGEVRGNRVRLIAWTRLLKTQPGGSAVTSLTSRRPPPPIATALACLATYTAGLAAKKRPTCAFKPSLWLQRWFAFVECIFTEKLTETTH